MAVCLASELIRTEVVLTLLFDKGFVNGLHRFVPIGIERGSVACLFPEMVSEADRIAERIDFPFTLMEFLFHVRKITFPFAAGRPFVEAVGIRIDVDTPGLTVR